LDWLPTGLGDGEKFLRVVVMKTTTQTRAKSILLKPINFSVVKSTKVPNRDTAAFNPDIRLYVPCGGQVGVSEINTGKIPGGSLSDNLFPECADDWVVGDPAPIERPPLLPTDADNFMLNCSFSAPPGCWCLFKTSNKNR
jgi:hypothetical protein